eukprot:TRINITY_DN4017_c0_g1_i3.p1 TRINITY_DN4017_c0_g1~~TRINITY_DN4017_c0_g1_i3.p1  ORF type:complete len:1604 (+),score=606.43 TRINITY_DN4017_c0_g1_i3:663-4814(+)
MLLSQHFGGLLFDALDNGIAVHGKVELNCDPLPQVSVDTYAGDGCPDTRLEGLCQHRELPHDRLCGACPLEVTLLGNISVCLWGNSLLPRKKATLMQYTTQLPLRADVIVASELPHQGCNISDFAPLAGKIVLLVQGGPLDRDNCLLMNKLRLASVAEVAAVIVMPHLTNDPAAVQADGPSEFVTIPVHSLSQRHAELMQVSLFGKYPHPDLVLLKGIGKMMNDSYFVAGPTESPRVTPPPSTSPVSPPVEEDTTPVWRWSVVMCVCLAVLVVEVLGIAMLLWHQSTQLQGVQDVAGRQRLAIPLGVASMAVSLTLLVVVAAVAFTLAYTAGQESTDTALDHGKEATARTTHGAALNAEELASEIRASVLNRVSDGLANVFRNMETSLFSISALHRNFDGDWVTFDAVHGIHASFGILTHDSSVVTNVFTTNGFFANHYMKTDDGEDWERPDTISGTVATNNYGWGYGVQSYYWSSQWRSLRESGFPASPLMYNASDMLGGNRGDPVEFVRYVDEGHTVVHVTKRTWPQVLKRSQVPISLLTPLFNGYGEFRGAVEARVDLVTLGGIVEKAVARTATATERMTLLVVDTADWTLVAASADVTSTRITSIVQYDEEHHLKMVENVFDIREMHGKALANYLARKKGWLRHTGEFEQSEEWTHQDPYTMLVEVRDGAATDIRRGLQVEMRGGACGLCVADDELLGKPVMAFDGDNILHLYSNVTTKDDFVARTRTSAAGKPWASSLPDYSEAHQLGDGTECISLTAQTIWQNTTTCMRHPPLYLGGGSYAVSMRVRPDELHNETLYSSATPRLFSDTLAGETNIRLFANGQLYLNVLRYGCRTAAVPGGLPVGLWTTVTAVVHSAMADGMPPKCKVYINGTLHSAGHITSRYSASDRVQPYYVGHAFKGRMDSLVVMRAPVLSDAEMLSLHTTPHAMVREVPKMRWFVAAQAMVLPGVDSKLPWSVAAMIPREDVMREVDANNARIAADFLVQEENTRRRLRHKTAETAAILAAVTLFCVAVFLVFNSMLTRPFAKYAVLMTEAAVLHIDEMPEGESFIRELRAMNSAMRVMLINLKEYRSYMPMSLQAEDGSDSDPDLSVASERSTTCELQPYTTAHYQSSVGRQSKAEFMCLIVKKQFTFSVVNLCDFHEKMAGMVAKEMVETHANILHLVLGVFTANKGISEFFSGDRFACTYNAARAAKNHRAAACTAVVCVAQRTRADFCMETSASVVSGEGRVGNMGNDLMKRFTSVSPVVTWGYALERFCRTIRAGVLVDAFVFKNNPRVRMQVKLIDVVDFPKRDASPIVVADIAIYRTWDHEWMYEPNETDHHNQWNNWANAIFSGNYDEANEQHRATSEDDRSPAYDKLQKAMVARHFEPTRLMYH